MGASKILGNLDTFGKGDSPRALLCFGTHPINSLLFARFGRMMDTC